MNLAFIGNFVEKKGNKLFINLVKKYNHLHQFYIFGYIVDINDLLPIKKIVKKEITYQEGQLDYLLKNNQIDCALTLSICPETFSRTFFNCLQAGVPVITSQLGFPYSFLDKNYPLFYKNEKELEQLLKKLDTNLIKKAKKQMPQTIDQKFLVKQKLKYKLIESLL